MNIFSLNNAYEQRGGVISNRIAPQTPGGGYQDPTSLIQPFNDVESPLPQKSNPLMDIGGSLIAAPVDIIDTIGTLIPGIERGDVNGAFYRGIGQPQFGTWVDENRDKVEIASGIVGAVTIAVGAEMAASRLAASAFAKASGLSRVITPVQNMVLRSQAAAQDAALTAAKLGQSATWYNGANIAFVGGKALQYGTKAAVGEAAIMATMQHNSFIWSDDMGMNLLFAGLGVGIGGLAGGIAARGQIMRFQNSPVIRNAFSEATDPYGYERTLIDAPLGAVASQNLAAVKPTSIATAFLLDAGGEMGDAVPNKALYGAKKQGAEAKALDVLQTVTSQGTYGIGGSKFAIDGTSEGLHIAQAIKADPGVVYGVASFAKIPEGQTLQEVIDAQRSAVIHLGEKKTATLKDKKKSDYLRAQTPTVLVNRSPVPVEEAGVYADYIPANTRFVKESGTDQIVWESQTTGKKLTLREDGVLSAPITKMHMHEVLDSYRAADQSIRKMRKRGDIITVPQKADSFTLDFAIEYELRGGEVDWISQAGLESIEEAQMLSLRKKANLLAKRKSISTHDRVRLNLALPTAAERIMDPKGIEFNKILQAATRDDATLAKLSEARLEVQRNNGLIAESKLQDNIIGESFTFNTATNKYGDQEWMKPVIMYNDDTFAAKWSKFQLADSIAETRTVAIRSLQNPAAPLTSAIAEQITRVPGFEDAQRITSLDDSQLPGAKTALGAMGAQFTSLGHRSRMTPAIKAAQVIRRIATQMTNKHFDDVLIRLRPTVDKLVGASGASSRVLVNQYLTVSSGWDIAREVVQPDGKIAFELSQTSPINQERLGRAVEDGELMINERTGAPVVLDANGNAFRQAMEAEFKAALKEFNAVRQSMGLSPIQWRAFWAPPPNSKAMFKGFVVDAGNRPVPGKAIEADTAEQFAERAARLQSELDNEGRGMRFVAKTGVERYSDMWEDLGLDFVDPQRMQVTAAGMRRQALRSQDINLHAVEDALAFLKSRYEQNANGIIRSIFDPQLKVASIRNAAQVQTTAKSAKTTGSKNIWEVYEETLRGVPSTARPVGVTKLANAFEEFSDRRMSEVQHMVSKVWPATTVSANWMRDILQQMPLGTSLNTARVKNLNDLSAELGQYTPFADAMEYAQYKLGIKAPWTSKATAQGINRIGSAVILRWFEMIHPIMNMTGIITNMSGLVSNKRVPLIGKVKGTNVVDSVQIMAKGLRRAWKATSDKDWEYGVKMGYWSQDVAELQLRMNVIKDRASWQKVMLGDQSIRELPKTASAKDRAKNFLQRKGVEGIASILTDTSEDFSRRWAHFIGLELADYHGITGMEARHAFAKQIADDSIANYDPLNRPEIFQSAFGSMWGLFQTYAQNYYERMFRWIEDEQYAAVGKSLAMQATMFGFMGLPGARQLAALVGGEEDGTGVMDGIYKRFGPLTGSVIAHGGVNQLTTIFGLPAVALHTRGEMNFRHPAGDFLTNGLPVPPGLEVLRDISNGMFQVVSGLFDPNVPDSGRYIAETIARNMPNRALHGTLTVLAAGGMDADANGNIMAQTQNWAESVYRMLGIRSQRQQAEVEAYFMNRNAMSIDAERLARLRVATRSIVREGNMDRLPEVFDDYLAAGGKPHNYANWIEGVIEEAGNTRTQNQLLKAMRGTAMREQAYRILLFTGAYPD